jgi:hypothetical protein
MLHPLAREYLDRHAEALVYIAQRIKDMDEDLARSPDFAAICNCAMIGLQREVGFPKETPVTACPEFKRADEQIMPSKVESPKQATLEPQKVELHLVHKTPTYDRDKLAWNRCPKCASAKVGHVSEKTGKGYFACFDCRIFLQPDGKTKEMVG